MAAEEGLVNGYFKGFPISITGGSVDGGPKLSIKQFPNRDTQNIETLGLKPRSYSVDINVNAKVDQDYFSYRNNLLALLESSSPGVLIHPLYGRLVDMVAGPYSLSENLNSFGDTTLSVTFEASGNIGIPQSAGNVVTSVQTSKDSIMDAVKASIENNFKVTLGFIGNFQAAVDKVDGFIDRVSNSTSFIGEAAATLDIFSSEIGRIASEVNSLVTDPVQFGLEFVALFDTVNGLYESAGATFETFLGFFGFGEDDQQYSSSTAGLIERQKNNETINGAVAAAALGHAYLAAVQLPFQTTRDIDETAEALDAQYELVQACTCDQEVKDAVTETRIQVVDIFNQARVNASQIITINTLPTSVRLLAYSYYGHDDLGEEIAELNSIDDVNFIDGPIEVLTA